MPGETNHGTPTPPAGSGGGASLQCAEFEALLMEALDGELSDERRESFDAHRLTCTLCGPMFTEVEAGRTWLRSLEPVEPSPYLVHNILAATTGVSRRRLATTATGERATLAERVRAWWDSWVAPVETFVRQPRFVMSFGMIFFTFSLVLSTAGFKASDVAKIDLRPAALRHAYNDAQIKLVHYYDNIRFVYEIESKLRELKRTTTPAEPAPTEKKENRNNDTSGQPEQKQDRNYSQQQSEMALASLRVQSSTVRLRLATSYEPRAMSELSLTKRAKLEPLSGLSFEARHAQPPVLLTTTSRRLV